MEQRRIHAVVSGRVQGVGYRFYAHDRARRLGVVGWVRNLPDGRVELEAQAADNVIERLCDKLREGPGLASVTGIQLVEIPVVTTETEFAIRY